MKEYIAIWSGIWDGPGIVGSPQPKQGVGGGGWGRRADFRAAVGLKGVCEGDAERPWRLMVNINIRTTS